MINDDDDDLEVLDDVTEDAPEDEGETAEPSDNIRGDVEEALGENRAKKGDPEPYRGIKGRADANPGGRYEGLEQYEAQCRQNGTTLQRAVADYASVETAWRASPVQGVKHICQRTGTDPRQLTAQLNQEFFGPQAPQAVSQFAFQAQHQQAMSQVEAFGRNPTYKHFGALRGDMAHLVQTRADLNALSRSNMRAAMEQAYSLALNARPTLRAKVAVEQHYARQSANAARYRKAEQAHRRSTSAPNIGTLEES